MNCPVRVVNRVSRRCRPCNVISETLKLNMIISYWNKAYYHDVYRANALAGRWASKGTRTPSSVEGNDDDASTILHS